MSSFRGSTPLAVLVRLEVVDLNLNPAQLVVLQWIADGCDMERLPSPTYKQSAISLRSRGLIELDRRKGHWMASLDPKGQFYLDHGYHPQSPPQLPPSTEATAAKEWASAATPAQATIEIAADVAADSVDGAASAPIASANPLPKDETIPMPSEVYRPHPAIRELVTYKKRLDVPEEAKGRALLILHALVQESLRRGWTVTPQLSTLIPATLYTSRRREWPSGSLFLIDAGHDPAAIHVRMKTRRVDHVLTEKELKEKSRGGYFYPPKYDYIPTDTMRLEVGSGYHSLVLEDTKTIRIERKLLRAIERIQQMTDDAIAQVEAQRLYEIAAAEARDRAAELAKRGRAYNSWMETLEGLRNEYVRHRDLTEAVDALCAAVPSHAESEHYALLLEYLSWAEEHLKDSDPFRSILLPRGDRPDLSYREWQQWKDSTPKWKR